MAMIVAVLVPVLVVVVVVVVVGMIVSVPVLPAFDPHFAFAASAGRAQDQSTSSSLIRISLPPVACT